MMQLFMMEISDKPDPEILRCLLPRISPEKQIQVSRMRFETDKKLRVYPEVLLRYKAGELLSVSGRDLLIRYNPFGKPYFPDHPNLHFNISHTRNAIAVGICDLPVGVDIEKDNPADMAVAQRVFTDNEIVYIYEKGGSTDRRFNEVWTGKESYLKWRGEGWPSDTGKIDVLIDPVRSMIATSYIQQYTLSVCSEKINEYAGYTQMNEMDFLCMINNEIF